MLVQPMFLVICNCSHCTTCAPVNLLHKKEYYFLCLSLSLPDFPKFNSLLRLKAIRKTLFLLLHLLSFHWTHTCRQVYSFELKRGLSWVKRGDLTEDDNGCDEKNDKGWRKRSVGSSFWGVASWSLVSDRRRKARVIGAVSWSECAGEQNVL